MSKHTNCPCKDAGIQVYHYQDLEGRRYSIARCERCGSEDFATLDLVGKHPTTIFWDDLYDEHGVLVSTNHQPENLGYKLLPSWQELGLAVAQPVWEELPWWKKLWWFVSGKY